MHNEIPCKDHFLSHATSILTLTNHRHNYDVSWKNSQISNRNMGNINGYILKLSTGFFYSSEHTCQVQKPVATYLSCGRCQSCRSGRCDWGTGDPTNRRFDVGWHNTRCFLFIKHVKYEDQWDNWIERTHIVRTCMHLNTKMPKWNTNRKEEISLSIYNSTDLLTKNTNNTYSRTKKSSIKFNYKNI